jgi:hypothetical protein
MGRRATVEDIQKHGVLEIEVPELLDDEGNPMTIKVRKVHGGERLALLPPLPPEVMKGEPKDLGERERAWLATLAPEAIEERRMESADFPYRLIAHATLDPVFKVADVRPLGNAAWRIADQIVMFSDNGRIPKAPVEAPRDDAAAAE